MRKVMTIAALFCSAISAQAAGIMTNSNQSASYHGNFAREASTEVDAAYYNPAGLGFISEGLHVALSWQAAYQTRNIESTFEGFKYNANGNGSTTQEYEGEVLAPCIPSLQAAYKKNKWTISLNFAVSGGGGKCTYDNGLPSFESGVAALPIQASAMGINKYSVESYMKGAQYIFSAQLGASYEINKFLAGYVGVRGCYAKNEYSGYIKNIKVNLPGTENMMRVDDLYAAMESSIPDAMKATMQAIVAQTADRTIDCKQNGMGIAPVIGADFNFKIINIGARYEFRTKINLENDTKSDAGQYAYQDGLKTRYDIPAIFACGISCQILKPFKVAVSYRHYFDSDSKMEKLVDANTTINKADFTGNGTNDYALSLEWNITEKIRLSGSTMRTSYDVEDDFQSDMNFSLSNWNYGLGLKLMPTKKLGLYIGGFYTDYDDDYEMDVNGRHDVYNRTCVSGTIGAEYHF